jgi:class 3 adenylate cyclase
MQRRTGDVVQILNQIEKFGGQVVKFAGDAVLAMFKVNEKVPVPSYRFRISCSPSLCALPMASPNMLKCSPNAPTRIHTSRIAR